MAPRAAMEGMTHHDLARFLKPPVQCLDEGRNNLAHRFRRQRKHGLITLQDGIHSLSVGMQLLGHLHEISGLVFVERDRCIDVVGWLLDWLLNR